MVFEFEDRVSERGSRVQGSKHLAFGVRAFSAFGAEILSRDRRVWLVCWIAISDVKTADLQKPPSGRV